jgi:hypothetical protein
MRKRPGLGRGSAHSKIGRLPDIKFERSAAKEGSGLSRLYFSGVPRYRGDVGTVTNGLCGDVALGFTAAISKVSPCGSWYPPVPYRTE